jgi:hypothetical protein
MALPIQNPLLRNAVSGGKYSTRLGLSPEKIAAGVTPTFPNWGRVRASAPAATPAPTTTPQNDPVLAQVIGRVLAGGPGVLQQPAPAATPVVTAPPRPASPRYQFGDPNAPRIPTITATAPQARTVQGPNGPMTINIPGQQKGKLQDVKLW